MDLKALTENTIGAATEVHRALGPGLLESTYELCLADLAVEDAVLVEIKAIDDLTPIHDAQLLSYLKLGGWNIGLIFNFNVTLLKHGIRRRVLNLVEEAVL